MICRCMHIFQRYSYSYKRKRVYAKCSGEQSPPFQNKSLSYLALTMRLSTPTNSLRMKSHRWTAHMTMPRWIYHGYPWSVAALHHGDQPTINKRTSLMDMAFPPAAGGGEKIRPRDAAQVSICANVAVNPRCSVFCTILWILSRTCTWFSTARCMGTGDGGQKKGGGRGRQQPRTDVFRQKTPHGKGFIIARFCRFFDCFARIHCKFHHFVELLLEFTTIHHPIGSVLPKPALPSWALTRYLRSIDPSKCWHCPGWKMLVFDFCLQQRCGGLGVRCGYANQVGKRGQKIGILSSGCWKRVLSDLLTKPCEPWTGVNLIKGPVITRPWIVSLDPGQFWFPSGTYTNWFTGKVNTPHRFQKNHVTTLTEILWRSPYQWFSDPSIFPADFTRSLKRSLPNQGTMIIWLVNHTGGSTRALDSWSCVYSNQSRLFFDCWVLNS